MVSKTAISAKVFERLAAGLGPSELERGEVIELSPGGLFHSGISYRVAKRIGDWAERHKTGRVFINETGVLTGRKPDTVRGVDVAYFSYERLPEADEPEGFTDIPPNLAVEIVGKGQGWNKMLEKAGEYLRMGVDLVWIIDPKKRRICVLRSEQEPQMLDESAVLADPHVLPKFRCRISDLFGRTRR